MTLQIDTSILQQNKTPLRWFSAWLQVLIKKIWFLMTARYY